MDGSRSFKVLLSGLLVSGTLLLSSVFQAGIYADSPPEAPTATAQILQPGQYHGDQVSAEDGETWMALVETEPGQYVLKSVSVHVETVKDEIADKDNQATGKKISLPDGGGALLLAKGLDMLQPGPVKTLHSEFQGFMSSAGTTPKPKNLRLDKTNQLIVDSLPLKGNRHKLLLTFVEGDNAQMLDIPEIVLDSNTSAGLVWAGDLDRDGYVDLLLLLGNHENVQNLTLFLSSPASQGNLLQKVAE